MRILLLEDEMLLRVSVKEFLEDLEYEVDEFSDGLMAYDALHQKSYDLLILDVNTPSMSGFELLQSVRRDGLKMPAIFLTSMVDITSLEEGYKKGCCDYIKKPFELLELELRIRQALKSYYMESEEIVDLGGDLKYDMLKGLLTLSGKEIVLRKMERDIFELLIKNINSTVSMEMLQNEVWGDYVEPATIRVQINNISKKLPLNVIQNRRGLGYIVEKK
ncbi:MAG: response regulator transcription factor [Sulfuricurvum sp.]